MRYELLTEANVKIRKGEKIGYYSVILHFAPSTVSGYQVCPLASAGCIATCLNTAGRGGMFRAGETTNFIQEARKRRTRMFFEQREQFMLTLEADILHAERRAKKLGLTLVVRLNGTSDLAWEKFRVGQYRNIFERFPLIQFYDYTKIVQRVLAQSSEHFPRNYHLTFSASENNHGTCRMLLSLGYSVTVVCSKDMKAWASSNVENTTDGDETDLRFLDNRGTIVLLTAKGKAKKDTSGFVIREKVLVQ
jgi:hypothetical protein